MKGPTTDTRLGRIPIGSFIFSEGTSKTYPWMKQVASMFSADAKDMRNSQNAILTNGEIYFPPDAVKAIGVDTLEDMNNKPKEGGHSAINRIMAMNTLKQLKPMYGGGEVKPVQGEGSLMGMRYGGMAKKKKKMMSYQDGGPIRGASPYSANMTPEGEFQQIMSVPASEVGEGEGLRFYLGEAVKPQLGLARRIAQDRAMVKMATTPQDSIPAAMIANYFSEEQPQAKKRGLRALLGMREGGEVMLPPQPADSLQIDARQADPSMYEGSVLGVVNKASELQESIKQDTVNKARKTLQLMSLIDSLKGAGGGVSLDHPSINPMPQDTADAMQARDLMEFFKMQQMQKVPR